MCVVVYMSMGVCVFISVELGTDTGNLGSRDLTQRNDLITIILFRLFSSTTILAISHWC